MIMKKEQERMKGRKNEVPLGKFELPYLFSEPNQELGTVISRILLKAV
jgi:hypothetical protein